MSLLGGSLGGHLGARASALLDGQLPAEEESRAWEHVHECCQCQHQVEREGWLKNRLAGLGVEPGLGASESLKGSLLGGPSDAGGLGGAQAYVGVGVSRLRRNIVAAAFGGGAVGAAMMGIIAVGAGPADAPTFQRHTPASAVTNAPAATSATMSVNPVSSRRR
ncbi:MAG: hypothetical protein QM638_17720 [Nocardioides sp.]|uniref:hypothetical protein n=1 Tax=Nocardioides sp. TaxID=35761 RepID=UPI0039E23940